MRKIFLAAVAVSALTGATAMAQNTTPPPANTPASTANPPATAEKTTPAPVPANGPNFIHVQSDDMLTSNVVGLDVFNGQNNDIGKIQDLVFDKSDKVVGYILSVGGFLGMGTHYVAVDPGSVSIKYDPSNKVWRASMNATKNQLKSAPEFKYGGQWTASRS